MKSISAMKDAPPEYPLVPAFQEWIMPYRSNSELPDSVKNNLPEHAQAIYREAFNHAWDEYKDPAKRRKGSSHEETAHRVAWAAVKEKYEKQDNQWVTKIAA